MMGACTMIMHQNAPKDQVSAPLENAAQTHIQDRAQRTAGNQLGFSNMTYGVSRVHFIMAIVSGCAPGSGCCIFSALLLSSTGSGKSRFRSTRFLQAAQHLRVRRAAQ
jgi:hypothetical protein